MNRTGRDHDELRPLTMTTGVRQERRRFGLRAARRHARHLHRQDRRRRARLAPRLGLRLAHGRVQHAADGHLRAHTARGEPRPAERAHARDPAAHRPLPARGGRLRRARRAHGLHRLRRRAGRRRHAHGEHLGRLRGARAGDPQAGGERAVEGTAAVRGRRRRVARRRRRRGRCSTSTTRRTPPPRST